ncbi:MAG: hypothetical protein Q8Q52_02140, partial [Acidimicrobiia bacterium]|nr:hypothetical protein [Acidimicrobiia bacterium]
MPVDTRSEMCRYVRARWFWMVTCSWAVLWVQGRFIFGKEACESFGAWGHTEVLGGWPLIDFVSREL